MTEKTSNQIFRVLTRASGIAILVFSFGTAVADHGGTLHIDFNLSVPATSSTGNYTVTWDAGIDMDLQEKVGAGFYTVVYSGTAGTKSFAGKADGTYTYRHRRYLCFMSCVYFYSAPESIVVSMLPPPAPEPFADQLEYEYEARTGDFDGNGFTDVLIDRLTPGGIDGSMQTVIVEGGVSGPTIVVPTQSELSVARAYPTNPNIELGGSDRNFDGFADILIVGLQSLNSPSYPYDCLILYASGEGNVAQPMGHQFIDEDYAEFFDNIVQATADPFFYVNNINVTLEPEYGVGVNCAVRFPPFTVHSLWHCRIDFFIIGYEVQVSGPGYHLAAPSATSAMNAIEADDSSNGDPWQLLSEALKNVLGVNSFGYQNDGSRQPTNYARDGDEVEDERDEIREAYMYQVILSMRHDMPPPPLPVEDWPRHEYDVGVKDVGTSICSTIGDTVFDDILAPGAPPPQTRTTRTIPQSVCTFANVMCWAKRNVAPRQDQSTETVKDRDDNVLDGTNPVRTHIFPNEGVIVNETLPAGVIPGTDAHELHDPEQALDCGRFADYNDINTNNMRCSYVHRQVYMNVNGTGINIRTHGEGHNPGVLENMANERFGKQIFGDIDRWIKRKLAKVGACIDDP